ncbi:MAG: hypothetical protein KDB22_07520 [Planctomycetales bacterium]|nr:hypothetical protein [Planctomycetales bacterium]
MHAILRTSAAFLLIGTNASAGVTLPAGQRWDAESRTFNGEDRSLVGGISFSVEGGSYAAFRDQFSWISTPSVGDFQSAVESAFAAWTTVDPTSGLASAFSFTPSLSTSVVTGPSFGTVRFEGAEIDIVASDAGTNGLLGLTTVLGFGVPVTLTSGVANYTQSAAIQAVDLHINNNPGAVYSLNAFRRVLTHELGHAIGLGDVDQGGQFIDDNYDSSSPVSTLNNSWAGLVDPLDPANSIGLNNYSISPSIFATTGIDLLMESNGLGVGASNPLSNLFPLTNDEYGMRQYLYPSLVAVPEPGSSVILGLTLLLGNLRMRRKRT